MSRSRFTGEPVPPEVTGPPNRTDYKNRNNNNKTWVRRTRQKEGFAPVNHDWQNPDNVETPTMYKMVPNVPPIMGKQPVPLIPYYPFNPVMYPNMVVKDDKGNQEPKSKFPMTNYMGPVMGVPPPNYVAGPFVPMPNMGVGIKQPQEPQFGKPFIPGPYYKEPQIRNITYKEPPIHSPGYDQPAYVNLSNVQNMVTVSKRNYETMSEISEEQDSSLSENDKSETGNEKNTLTEYDIKYYTPFLPKPPERYKTKYDLHDIKVFLPVGVKAYVKNLGLNPKVSMGFETGPVRNGKLVLLLDLDNTLLHTSSQTKLDMLEIDTGDFVDSLGDPELYTFNLPNFQNIKYYMKLRPCIREFLQILSLYYEMSIYTNATKEYADVVISILDPDRSLFMDRIVARNSVDEKDLLKSASRLYPELDTRFILAFDDRRDVWSDIPHKHVVRAEHYDFFESYLKELNNNYPKTGSPTQNPESKNLNTNNQGQSSKTQTHDYTFNVEQESDSEPEQPREKMSIVDYDRHLKYMVTIFLEIHKKFFSDPFINDVGDILESIQTQVLKGVGILLTGYRKNAKSPNSVLHADCEQMQREILSELGASAVVRLNDSKLTHIMAGKNCTDNITKSRDKQYNHIHKVHTLWLYSCRATFSRVDEALFKVDDVCNIYGNEPPQLPNKDHWKFLVKPNIEKEEAESDQEVKRREKLSVRIFMGTGTYSNGTEVISSVEKIVIKWDPSKTKLLQNSLVDSSRMTTRQTNMESTPFTNAMNPNKYAY